MAVQAQVAAELAAVLLAAESAMWEMSRSQNHRFWITAQLAEEAQAAPAMEVRAEQVAPEAWAAAAPAELMLQQASAALVQA
jgi:hypothetical protein